MTAFTVAQDHCAGLTKKYERISRFKSLIPAENKLFVDISKDALFRSVTSIDSSGNGMHFTEDLEPIDMQVPGKRYHNLLRVRTENIGYNKAAINC